MPIMKDIVCKKAEILIEKGERSPCSSACGERAVDQAFGVYAITECIMFCCHVYVMKENYAILQCMGYERIMFLRLCSPPETGAL